MADDPQADKLRQMAEHRGLKLVKSRRRKAGAGDYGMFGLTDAAGKALLGIGDAGLTAGAQDIETYLRAGALGTWKDSAKAVPDRPAPRGKPRHLSEAPEPAVAKARPGTHEVREKRPSPPQSPVEKAEPAPTAEPVVRAAKPSDAGNLAGMLSQLRGIAIDARTALRNLEAIGKAGGGLLLAELAGPIGCCGWAIVPTLHRGPVGRITVLFVDRDHRRRGVATRLIAAAEQALASAGCPFVEAMSDIALDNAHAFFRALDFAQTSYRFTRKIERQT